MTTPPAAKYKYTLTIKGNSHQEIQDELLTAVNGGYLLDSDYETRDSFDVIGGSTRSVLEHTNPDMTPELYFEALKKWRKNR